MARFGEFYRSQSEKVSFGELVESFVHATIADVFRPVDGWSIRPQFYDNIGVPQNSRDVFDFLVGKTDASCPSLLIQVTHYTEDVDAIAEPNRTYEVYETFEEFTQTMASHLSKATKHLTGQVRTVNILLGNKNYVRPWATRFEDLVYDLCIYPHYNSEGEFSGGVYQSLNAFQPRIVALRQAGKEGSEYDLFLDEASKSALPRSLKLAYDILVQTLRSYADAGFPQNDYGLRVWQARSDYLSSVRFEENLAYLDRQLDEFGLPTIATSIRSNFTTDVAEYIQNFLADFEAEIEALSCALATNAQTVVRELWDEDNDLQRNANRMLLRVFAGVSADQLYDARALEQTLFTRKLPADTTNRILGILIGSLDRAAGIHGGLSRETRTEFYRSVLAQRKQAVAGLANQANTRSGITPVTSEAQTALAKAGFQCSSCKSPVFFAARLGLGPQQYPLVRLQRITPKGSFFKSKFTKGEAWRRAKEEGGKAWAVLLDDTLTVQNAVQLQMIVDGKWSHDALYRLVQSGWRVHLNTKALIEDLQD